VSGDTFVQRSTTSIEGRRYEVEATYSRADRRLREIVVRPVDPRTNRHLEADAALLRRALEHAAGDPAPAPRWPATEEDTAIAARVHVAIVRGGWHTTSDIAAHVHMYPAERVARVVQLMAEHHLLYADESVWPVRYQLKS